MPGAAGRRRRGPAPLRRSLGGKRCALLGDGVAINGLCSGNIDGATWATLYSTTASDGGVDDLTGLSGTGRYLRVTGTVRATTWGYSLFELEAYGAGSTVLAALLPAWAQEGGASGTLARLDDPDERARLDTLLGADHEIPALIAALDGRSALLTARLSGSSEAVEHEVLLVNDR